MTEQTKFLTAIELAEQLQIAPETVRQWTRRGVIPSLRLSAKVIRYEPEEVLAALRSRSGASRSEDSA